MDVARPSWRVRREVVYARKRGMPSTPQNRNYNLAHAPGFSTRNANCICNLLNNYPVSAHPGVLQQFVVLFFMSKSVPRATFLLV